MADITVRKLRLIFDSTGEPNEIDLDVPDEDLVGKPSRPTSNASPATSRCASTWLVPKASRRLPAGSRWHPPMHNAFQRIRARDLFAWHMAEEIGHRTVAFDVFESLVGSYPYRIRARCWSQWHYVRAIDRFVKVMAGALGRKLVLRWRPLERSSLRNCLRTLSPRYNPANIAIPHGVDALLAEYSERAAKASGA